MSPVVIRSTAQFVHGITVVHYQGAVPEPGATNGANNNSLTELYNYQLGGAAHDTDPAAVIEILESRR